MTKRDLLSLALTILGIYTLINFIAETPRLVSLAVELWSNKIEGMANPKLYSAMGILSLILLLALSIVLVFSSDVISRKLVRNNSDLALPNDKGWSEKLFIIAIRVIGVVLIVYSIPSLLDTLASSALSLKYISGDPFDSELIRNAMRNAWISQWKYSIHYGISIAIGCYLMSGASHLVNLLYKDDNAIPESD